MKFARLQWQIFAAYSSILLLLLAGLQIYLYPILRHSLVDQKIQTLREETGLLAWVIEERFPGSIPEEVASRIVGEYGRRLRLRVTLVDPEGKVIGDSEVDPAEVSRMENHRNRPEIVESLKSGFGTSLRFSDTLKTSMIYAAKPLTRSGVFYGWLRLADPLTDIDNTLANIRKILFSASVAALFLALAISLGVSRWLSRPIQQLIEAVDRIAQGDLEARVSTRHRDETSRLALAFNHMAERLQDQIKRTRSEGEQLAAILRGLAEGVMVLNQEGKITLINNALRGILEIPGPVEGKFFREVLRLPELSEGVEQVLKGKEWVSLSFAYGQRFFEANIVGISATSAAGGVVAVFHDTTKLEHLERVRRDFVANVSHELRTPLTAIKGYAETLLEGALSDPETARTFLEIIEKHANRLSALVADLLVLSTVESESAKVGPVPVNLRETAETGIKAVEARAREKSLRIDNLIPAGLPLVSADPKLLDEVFINLLDNGVKYTPERGQIFLSASLAGEMVQCQVSDSGIGIPLEDLTRIFERFYRVDKARSRQMGGTGLGLSIVKHIIETLGGKVWAESEYGKGSSFFFTLPVSRKQSET